MVAYDPAEWTDLFVATAGATAALAGLVFVAVSINLDRILKYEGLPDRALETLLLLMLSLLVSIACLIPGQSDLALGVELALLGGAVGLGIARMPTIGTAAVPDAPRSWTISRWTVRLMGTLPFVIAGISIAATTGGGLYWVVAGIALGVTGAVTNAWVLLVEILR